MEKGTNSTRKSNVFKSVSDNLKTIASDMGTLTIKELGSRNTSPVARESASNARKDINLMLRTNAYKLRSAIQSLIHCVYHGLRMEPAVNVLSDQSEESTADASKFQNNVPIGVKSLECVLTVTVGINWLQAIVSWLEILNHFLNVYDLSLFVFLLFLMNFLIKLII